jgi:hypothetical protein
MSDILGTKEMAEAMTGLEHREQWCLAIEGEISVMRANLDGKVMRSYDVMTDSSVWVFGSVKWDILRKPGTDDAWEDDPLSRSLSRGGRNEVPLPEFLTYLRDWYWPRRRLMAVDTNAPGLHLAAAREVAA